MRFLLLDIFVVFLIQNHYGSIYFTGPNAVSYDNAIEYCDNAGAVLGSITNINEYNDAMNACIAGDPPEFGCWFV